MNYFNYFTEIEDTFVRRRGKHLFLSPLDWALIESWKERGIPLHIVIRAIESVFDGFDRQPPGTRSIRSLFYCREEVEVQYAEWLRSQAGRADEEDPSDTTEIPDDAIRKHLADCKEKLEGLDSPNLGDGPKRAAGRLAELLEETSFDNEKLEARLADIERMLERSMLENWDKDDLEMIRKDVEKQLREHKSSMTADEYDNTFKILLIKVLREAAGVPRLGLFYL